MHTSESLFGNKYIDPMKIDPFGAATKRMMREQNKKK